MSQLININSFEALVAYLQSDLGWPVSLDEIEDQVFEYESFELGIDDANAVRIDKIYRFRAFEVQQPWSVFYIQFATGSLPIVVMRRILSHLVVKRQQRHDQQSWQMHDLLFITNFGESDDRQISFAHFTNSADGKSMPTLKVLGWDGDDTKLRIDDVERRLKSYLTYPDADLAHWPQRWANAFTLRPKEVIKTTKELSVALARLARDIRARLMTVLQYETDKGPFTQLMKSFQTALIQDLKPDDFADMYAQTISYGLLSTRIADPSKQSVDDLAAHLQTNPFLRELLQTFLQMGGRDTRMGIDFDELGINDVIELLNQAQMDEVLRDFNNRNAHEDPVIHFYELFLKEYDAKKRMQRGVFYTPRPVVSYIVRSVHELLQTEFGLADGLAATETWADMQQRLPDLQLPPQAVYIDGPSEERIDPATPFVQVLDPATGTGTFLVEVIEVIHQTLMAKWSDLSPAERAQRWNSYVPQHLLPRLFGYELMMAPYTIAHLKIGLKLVETGYVFAGDQRANIYLTNALEPAQAQLALAGINPALAHEAQAVNAVKLNTRFTVVVGNPPYANFGMMNKSKFILNLLKTYKNGLTEKKINIDDDFIKFIRFAQYVIDNTQTGFVGFITNNVYLDAVTHRVMRKNLLDNFNTIILVNLFGNLRRSEGDSVIGNDENVFDIQVGATISFLIKTKNDLAQYYFGLTGSRNIKYQFLNTSTVSSCDKIEFLPQAPNYFYIPKSREIYSEYNLFESLTQIYLLYGNGIGTDRDSLFYDYDKNVLLERMKVFYSNKLSSDFIDKYNVNNSSSFPLLERRARTSFDEGFIVKCLYRQFEYKWIYYNPQLISRPSYEIMKGMYNNSAIVTTRLLLSNTFQHVFVTNSLTDRDPLSSVTSERSYIFPTYVLKDEKLESNINPSYINLLNTLGINTSSIEDIRHYIYAILHSPQFRKRYYPQLKIDFPRIPLPGGPDVFYALATLGEQLVALHLMESPLLDTPITHTVGSNWEVSKVGYADGTVWIDGKGTKSAYVAGTTGFAGVPEEVWNFHIGGYQVCEKWLKDRKGRTLTAEHIAHYQKIVVALHETIRLMAEIDVVIDEHGGWPGAFHLEDVGDATEPARPQFGQVESSTPKRKAAEDKQQGSFLDE